MVFVDPDLVVLSAIVLHVRIDFSGCSPMYCSQREHLLARYESALRTYRLAVQALTHQAGAELGEGLKQADLLHEALESARIVLDHHSREHRCGYAEARGA